MILDSEEEKMCIKLLFIMKLSCYPHHLFFTNNVSYNLYFKFGFSFCLAKSHLDNFKCSVCNFSYIVSSSQYIIDIGMLLMTM